LISVVFTVPLTTAIDTHAQDCTDYPDYFHWSAALVLEANAVGVSENSSKVYLVDNAGRLGVFDMENPSSPLEIGGVELNVQPTGLALAGDVVFVTTQGFGVCPVDVSDPTAPDPLPPFVYGGPLGRIEADGLLAAVPLDDDGILVYDATDPGAPTAHWLPLNDVFDLDVLAGYVYVARNTLTIVDARDPHDLQILSTWRPDPYWIKRVVATPGYAICWATWRDPHWGDNYYRSYTVDMADPEHPVEVASSTPSLESFADEYMALGSDVVTIDGNHLSVYRMLVGSLFDRYFATSIRAVGSTGSLILMSIADQVLLAFDPVNEEEAPFSVHAGTEGSRDVVASGTRAYLANSQGLRAFDVNDPANPIQTAVLPQVQALRLDIAGDMLVSADYSGGISIVDITSQAAPVHVASAPCLGTPEHVTVVGDVVYAACGEVGLTTIDISDPHDTRILGWADTPIHATAIDVEDGLAAIADGLGSVVLIDVTAPGDPRIEALIGIYGTARDVRLEDGILYLAAGDEGVNVYDVTVPDQPELIVTLGTERPARRITVADGLVFVGLDSQGVMLYDMSNPIQPLSFGYLDISANPCIALADDTMVLSINLLITAPLPCDLLLAAPAVAPPRAGIALAPNYPNPFNPSTTLRFHLASEAHVRLTILDVKGRRVRTLIDRAYAAGPHEVAWDGRDGEGAAVGSGVYFARAESELGAAATRMTLIR